MWVCKHQVRVAREAFEAQRSAACDVHARLTPEVLDELQLGRRTRNGLLDGSVVALRHRAGPALTYLGV